MPQKTEKDYWIEMSVREIWTQARFAERAYGNIDPKAESGNDAVFSSIHSFLGHCAMISKMLKSYDRKTPQNLVEVYLDKLFVFLGVRKKVISIGEILNIENSSIIHNRRFRNHLEHYDERLRSWIKRFAAGANIGTYNIGPRASFNIANMILVSHYDPGTHIFTFLDKNFNLSELFNESQHIMTLADTWVNKIENRNLQPPFA